LELTYNGKTSVKLQGGGERVFLEDGDTVTLNGICGSEGNRVGFGGASGTILPALKL
jgi:fumarylacetoacetase